MPKTTLTMAALVMASFTAATLAPATAVAAPAEWMLAGKTLTEEGLTTVALGAVSKTDASDELSGGGLTITCSGNLESKKPEIVKTNKIKAEALILTGCTATPSTCTIPTTIGTVPIEGEATLDGTKAVKAVAKPQSGRIFTTIKVGGEEKGCAAAGNKPVSGDFAVLAPEGQSERTEQLLEVNQASSTLLLLGSASASLKGSALLATASCVAWGFL